MLNGQASLLRRVEGFFFNLHVDGAIEGMAQCAPTQSVLQNVAHRDTVQADPFTKDFVSLTKELYPQDYSAPRVLSLVLALNS